jgi:hypothetical protein
MRRVSIVGIGEQIVEAAPVLEDTDTPPVNEKLGVEQAQSGIALELRDHGRHGRSNAGPLTQGEEAIDAHADEEDKERLAALCGKAAGKNRCHEVLPFLADLSARAPRETSPPPAQPCNLSPQR